MNKKSLLLFLEVFVCFSPLVLLWSLGAFFAVINLSEAHALTWQYVLFAGLILLGGFGLWGIVSLYKYVVSARQLILSVWVIAAVIAGVVICVGFIPALLHGRESQFFALVFLLPILCALHFLFLAREKCQQLRNQPG